MTPHNSILEGIHYRTGKAIRVGIRNGTIHSLTDIHELYQKDANGRGSLPTLAPGLTDLQVNGFMGVDFNDPSLTAEDLERASGAMLETGVTRFYPTIITGPPERTLALIRTIAGVAGRKGSQGGESLAARMIGGIHLEGPFISKEDGPRGAHPREFCAYPDIELLRGWQEEAGGLIRILTLAPELPGSVPMIRACNRMGVRVGIGHTACNTDELRSAVDAGAVLSTHLGNGAHGMLPRHPNYIWDQLAEERLHATMIADGFHLPDAVLKVFIRTKGEKAILVSDGMPYSGLEPGIYQSPATGKVQLTGDGKLYLEGRPGTLAGSATFLIDGVRKIARMEGFPYAWHMASLHPSRLMNGESMSGIEVGAPADLVMLDPKWLEIQKVYKGGRA